VQLRAAVAERLTTQEKEDSFARAAMSAAAFELSTGGAACSCESRSGVWGDLDRVWSAPETGTMPL
jgi:hypothetical protein